jgi:phosphoglycerate dehydrogenase-like enzyme
MPEDRVRVLASLAGFGDLMLPALSAAVPEADFALLPTDGARPEPAQVLVTLLNDRPDLRPALAAGVRWIHVLGAGIDGFPLDLVGDRILTCSRGASSGPIAEYVLATMLAFEKHIPDVWLSAPPARWNTASLGGLAGRTLGLVGVGAIGQEVARRALAFDMEVVAARRRPDRPAGAGIEVAPLEQVVDRADHLVITAASTPSTHHLIGAEVLARVKPGVHLVNVARGELIDQNALVSALDGGRVARASLDVVTPEPLPAGHPLYEHPGVRLTAHVSWSAPQTTGRTLQIFASNFNRWAHGQPMEGVVDPTLGY